MTVPSILRCNGPIDDRIRPFGALAPVRSAGLRAMLVARSVLGRAATRLRSRQGWLRAVARTAATQCRQSLVRPSRGACRRAGLSRSGGPRRDVGPSGRRLILRSCEHALSIHAACRPRLTGAVFGVWRAGILSRSLPIETLGISDRPTTVSHPLRKPLRGMRAMCSRTGEGPRFRPPPAVRPTTSLGARPLPFCGPEAYLVAWLRNVSVNIRCYRVAGCIIVLTHGENSKCLQFP